jgi:transcriptional regulator with XRE-family HTH domain
MARARFGEILKDWRGRRRMSQLDLALDAGVSARHVAFLETGRSRPSRSMVDQLIAALEVPHRARNDLLVTAGFAPAYTRRDLDDPSFSQVRDGLDRLMANHEPWPALMLDRDWNIVKANSTSALMLDLIGGDASDNNLLTRLANAPRVSEVIENWTAVAAEFASRLKSEALQLADAALLKRATDFLSTVLKSGDQPNGPPMSPLFTISLKLPDGDRLQLFSILGQFSSAFDVTAAELRLELFFPADEATRTFLEKLGQQTPGRN